MSTAQRNILGQVYRCEVCGAEVSVAKGGRGALTPRCCNEPMALLGQRQSAFLCPVCGAELLVLSEGPGTLAPRCCNLPMVRRGRDA